MSARCRLRPRLVLGAAAVLTVAGAPAAVAAEPEPGAVLRAGTVRVNLPGVRAEGWRVTYATRGPAGATVATAAVLVPEARQSRRAAVVGTELGSQGLADACAPSRNLGTGLLAEGPMLASLVARGFTVVVADGLGLGTGGLPTYGAGRTEAPALLDAVRAARALPAAGVGPAWPVGLLGYSVGAAAVAAAAAEQPALAPELPLTAAAVGGAPVDLPAYVAQGLRSGATVAALSAVAGLRAAEPSLPPAPLTALGRAATGIAQRSCIFPAIGLVALLGPPGAERFTTRDPFADPAWRAAADRQWPGATAPRVPVLLFHALRDQAVPLAGARRLLADWRAAGANVTWWGMPYDHVGGLLLGAPAAVEWLAARVP